VSPSLAQLRAQLLVSFRFDLNLRNGYFRSGSTDSFNYTLNGSRLGYNAIHSPGDDSLNWWIEARSHEQADVFVSDSAETGCVPKKLGTLGVRKVTVRVYPNVAMPTTSVWIKITSIISIGRLQRYFMYSFIDVELRDSSIHYQIDEELEIDQLYLYLLILIQSSMNYLCNAQNTPTASLSD
jgi:hypothetical protein